MERRDVATLHSIVARCVRIGTEVHSDDWATYWQMDHHIHSVSHHKAVVHCLQSCFVESLDVVDYRDMFIRN